MLTYYTTSKPLGNVLLKQAHRDFIVNEYLDNSLISKLRRIPKPGDYILIRIYKPYGVDTASLIEKLSYYGISRKKIYILGLKDKRSYAVQHIFLHKAFLSKLEDAFSKMSIEHTVLGFISREYITRNFLRGNIFKIRLWNLDDIQPIKSFFYECSPSKLPNFFGYQRFGVHRLNHLVGRLIIKKGGYSSPVSYGEKVPQPIDIVEKVFNITPRNDDIIKVLSRLQRHVIKFMVNAYQSYLFNIALSRRIQDGLPLEKCVYGDYYTSKYGVEICRDKEGCKAPPLIPIIGYAQRFKETRVMDKYYMELMKEEDIHIRDFYLKEFGDLRFPGGFRRASLSSSYLYAYRENDSVFIYFDLERGMYGTILLRELIKPSHPFRQGF